MLSAIRGFPWEGLISEGARLRLNYKYLTSNVPTNLRFLSDLTLQISWCQFNNKWSFRTTKTTTARLRHHKEELRHIAHVHVEACYNTNTSMVPNCQEMLYFNSECSNLSFSPTSSLVLPPCHFAVYLTELWAVHPYRNDLLRGLEIQSARPQLFGEGLCHFMWNNKEWCRRPSSC